MAATLRQRKGHYRCSQEKKEELWGDQEDPQRVRTRKEEGQSGEAMVRAAKAS